MRNLEFDRDALKDLEWWILNNKKTAIKIMRLVLEWQKTPFHGTGKPERLTQYFK